MIASRIEPRRRTRFRKHANPFTVRDPPQVPNWAELYGRVAPLALDVGFGAGQFLVGLARKHPAWNILGLEIREHLVASALRAIQKQGLTNAHALLANASFHVADLLPQRSVVFVSMNFPDPWYKKRHHKRRVLRPTWLDDLEPKLKVGAEFHGMSDYEPIALEMQEILDGRPGWTSLEGPGQLAEQSTTGITSEREVKHLARGNRVYRLHFRYSCKKRT